jgi:hypothetical protein
MRVFFKIFHNAACEFDDVAVVEKSCQLKSRSERRLDDWFEIHWIILSNSSGLGAWRYWRFHLGNWDN